MNRYMITVKEINTDCFCVDGETMEKAADALMENFHEYQGNGMGEGTLEVLETEQIHTNIETNEKGWIINSAEMIKERRKHLTNGFKNQITEKEKTL